MKYKLAVRWIVVVLAAVILFWAAPSVADTIITGSGWNSAAIVYGGDTGASSDSYQAYYDSSSYGGAAYLKISNDVAGATDAYVRVTGTFGPLDQTSMSFVAQGFSGSGDVPYADMHITDGIGDTFAVVAYSGSTIDGSTDVGIINTSTGAWVDNIPSYSTTKSLSDFYSETFNGVEFGDMTVITAQANMGLWGGSGLNESGWITQMTICSPTPAPEPSTLLLVCFGLAGLAAFRMKSRTA